MTQAARRGSWSGRAKFLDAALERLEQHLPEAIELRHRIHADPRVSGDERDTTVAVAEALGVDDGAWITEGMVARIGAADGPCIAVRAELDALPLAEDSGVPFSSTGDVAHLCGHDVHLAALAAVGNTVRELGVPVPLLVVLQPREETLPCGAEDFVGSPHLLRHDVRAFIGVHLQPRLAPGKFSAAPGPVNAAADEFRVVLVGKPAHGAYPQLARDPIVALGALITGLQHLVSRRADPMSPAVVTVGEVRGGSSFNAIPGSASLRGTIRTYDESFRTKIHEMVRQVADGIATAHDCTATTEVGLGEPVMVNDDDLAHSVTAALEEQGLVEGTPLRSCGADDFAFYGTKFPSLMVFNGTGDGSPDTPSLHHPAFVPPDSAVGDVARVMLGAYASVAESIISTPDPQ